MDNAKMKKKTKFSAEMAKAKTSFRKNWVMYLFLLLPIIYFIVFKFTPMAGNIVAFRKYKLGGNYFGDEWSGLKYFQMFMTDATFWKKFSNTLTLSLCLIIFTFPLPIIFSLFLNEVGNKKYKKVVQSVTIIPRFFSTIVVIMIFTTLLSPSVGLVNKIIEFFGGEAIFFLIKPEWFRVIYILSDVWQFMGWSSIIYMAVLASADQEQYEAAMVDGANRWKQTIHITLPVLIPTISINFIIQIGNILNVSFEKVLLLYQPSTQQTADIIQTYVYRMGLLNKSYSFGTAVGLFQSVIGLTLLFISNKVINKYFNTGLW